MIALSEKTNEVSSDSFTSMSTPVLTRVYASMLDILSNVEIERLGILREYDYDEDMVVKRDKIALDILNRIVTEIRSCVVGVELYGKLK